MKKLLIILLLMMLYSCSIIKNKNKQKQLTELNSQTTTQTELSNKNQEVENSSFSDSTVHKSQYNGAKSLFANSQNFNLTNNGKCSDPGAVRFVQVTDSHGNQTSIPVNDNTDLQFGSQSKLETENSTLKIENSSLIKENDSIKKDNETLQSTNINQSAELISKYLELDLKTKSSPLSAFIWMGVLSVIAWELLKFYFKKLIKS
ncbi:hypothetical protein FNJ88_06240 [Chryseobacterium sp. SNU WT5]|uniref:hypothetical protein n=1 Tax=Chryseobacterium sp. SNU WT5 TaxID=2594269 RepID=UPI00117CAB7B|nr:hypothetical protein [Chryseobacterium sp. SNU WT5]QDP85181.1 hypothetical protein FNJ88_06240 [Chryseobacterium sp. SNU WT5]